MAYYCCGDENREQMSIACLALVRSLVRESDPAILDEIDFMVSLPYSGDCIRAVPDRIVLGALERVGSDRTREQLVVALREYEPTEAIARALIAQMARTRASGMNRHITLAGTLARYGEPELALVVAALRAPDVKTRQVAAWTLWLAAEAPLALRGLDAALERATRDDDDEVAGRARSALERRRQFRGERLDDAARRLASNDEALQWFGRRVAFCGSQAAGAALDRAAADPNPHEAGVAHRLIETRRARCQRHAP